MADYFGHHAVVIGGGLAGLMTARVLGDHFDTVTVLERDCIESESAAQGLIYEDGRALCSSVPLRGTRRTAGSPLAAGRRACFSVSARTVNRIVDAIGISHVLPTKSSKAAKVDLLVVQILISGRVFCGASECFLADVGVAVTHCCAFMADQCLDDAIGNASVFEERNCRVAKGVEAQVYHPRFPPRPIPRLLWFRGSRNPASTSNSLN
jgi:hypothetical protein